MKLPPARDSTEPEADLPAIAGSFELDLPEAELPAVAESIEPDPPEAELPAVAESIEPDPPEAELPAVSAPHRRPPPRRRSEDRATLAQGSPAFGSGGARDAGFGTATDADLPGVPGFGDLGDDLEVPIAGGAADDVPDLPSAVAPGSTAGAGDLPAVPDHDWGELEALPELRGTATPDPLAIDDKAELPLSAEDLPAVGGVAPSFQDDWDFPASTETGLPNVASELPSPAVELPSPAADLPSAAAALPSPAAAQLPTRRFDEPAGPDAFGELDLPVIGADLPAPSPDGLPAYSGGGSVDLSASPEPFGAAGSELFDAGAGPAASGEPPPGRDPFGEPPPGPDPFGEPPPGPDPFGEPPPGPDPFGEPPPGPDPFGAAGPTAGSFGGPPEAEGVSEEISSEESNEFELGRTDARTGGPAADPVADPEADASLADGASDGPAAVRRESGVTDYGEVSLEEGDSAASVALDDGRPASDDELDFDPTAGRSAAAQGSATQTIQFQVAAPGSAAAEIQARKKRRRLRIAVAGVLVLGLSGAALTLVPSLGPFGAHFLIDQLRRGDHERLLSTVAEDTRRRLGRDTHPAAREAFELAQRARAQAPRYSPLTAYASFVGYVRILRFGPEPEVQARGQVLLDELADVENVPGLELARAARAAAEGQLARARQTLDRLVQQHPDDIDVAILRGEVELRARDHAAALEAWGRAVELEKSARTAFGLARAHAAAEDLPAARRHAEEALRHHADHTGTRILLASIVWRTDQNEAEAAKLLEEVVNGKGLASPDEVVQAQTLLGEVHLSRGRISHAEKAFSEALKINPKAARALSGFGDAMYRAGRYSQALARFKAAVQADPDDIGAKVGVARTSIALERIEEAAAMLSKLRQSHPKDVQVNYWTGRVQEALGDRKQAEEAYRAAIEAGGSEPESVHAYIALAMLESQLGRLEDAQVTLGNAQKRLPESPEIHKALGKVAMGQGRYASGLEEFERALRLDENDVEARFLLGTALARSRRFEEALDVFEAVAKIDRDFPGLALERGLLFQESGRGAEALKEYEAALAKAPNDPDLMLRVGCGKAGGKASGESAAEAEKLLRKVLEQRPNSAETHHCLGRALLARNNLADALRELRRAIDLDGNRAEYHLYVGWAANEAGNFGEAAKSLNVALELDRGLGDAYWQRGVLMLRQTRPKDAIDDLKKALELRPSRYEAHAALAESYYDLGMEQAALAEWQKAIAADPTRATWRFRYGRLLNLNRRHDAAVAQLQKAIELAAAKDERPPWLAEAHRLTALSLGQSPAAGNHWEEFLRLGPADSPFRAEAIGALQRLGRTWED